MGLRLGVRRLFPYFWGKFTEFTFPSPPSCVKSLIHTPWSIFIGCIHFPPKTRNLPATSQNSPTLSSMRHETSFRRAKAICHSAALAHALIAAPKLITSSVHNCKGSKLWNSQSLGMVPYPTYKKRGVLPMAIYTWNPNDFLKVNPPKQGLFQSKRGSFGFQVYT